MAIVVGVPNGDQGQREPRLGAARRRRRAGAPRPPGRWSRPAPAPAPGFTDEEYAAAGATIVADRRRGVRRRRPDRQGQGADPGGVPPLPGGPAAVHLPAPRGRPGADRVPAGAPDRLDRVRDGADPRPQAAAADPDERGRRPDGGAGRRPRPGEPGRRRRASCSAASPAPRRPRSPSSAAASPAPRPPRSPSACAPSSGSSTPTRPGWPTCPTSSGAGSTWSSPNRARHRRLGRRVRRGHRRRPRPRRQGPEAASPGR